MPIDHSYSNNPKNCTNQQKSMQALISCLPFAMWYGILIQFLRRKIHINFLFISIGIFVGATEANAIIFRRIECKFQRPRPIAVQRT